MKRVDITPRGGIFKVLVQAQQERLLAAASVRHLARGEVLFETDGNADTLFIVARGVLAAIRAAGEPAGELRAGDLAGEAAFFACRPHNMTATAARDCEVFEISRSAWEGLVGAEPEIAAVFLRNAAGRLHEAATAQPASSRRQDPRVIAIVNGGRDAIPPEFNRRLAVILARNGTTVIDRDSITDRFGAVAPDDPLVSAWLDELELADNRLFLVAEPELNAWTAMCIRNADEAVIVTTGDAPGASLTPVEKMVEAVHAPAARRLVRIHPRRVGVVSGTAAWLARIEVALHHHVALEDDADLEGLGRFLTGRAIGFVAGGGGGLGPAHVGIYRAFREKGVTFDAFVGTSVGSAMLAGFAFLAEHDALTAGTEDIFVTSRGLKRPTLPRHSLLDHKVFDEALARAYGSSTMVEDCWRPYAAVATNLSTHSMQLIRTGLMWKAVRASVAVPCMLPPFFTDDGMMLVDGSIMDDAPLAPMQSLKSGPNLVVHFGHQGRQRFDFAYEDLPGRGRLIAALFNPRARLPRAPKLMSMLFRTLVAHQRYELSAGPHDLVLTPPALLPGAPFMNFDRHMEVFNAAHMWARHRIEDLSASDDAALAAILDPSGGASPLRDAA